MLTLYIRLYWNLKSSFSFILSGLLNDADAFVLSCEMRNISKALAAYTLMSYSKIKRLQTTYTVRRAQCLISISKLTRCNIEFMSHAVRIYPSILRRRDINLMLCIFAWHERKLKLNCRDNIQLGKPLRVCT